jgi:hypothetical protein
MILKLSYHKFALATNYDSVTNLKYTTDKNIPPTKNIPPMTINFPPPFLCQKKTSLWQNWHLTNKNQELAFTNTGKRWDTMTPLAWR